MINVKEVLGANIGSKNCSLLETSTHPTSTGTFDARILSLCLDNFLVQHSVRATHSVPGQRETCLDLVFTKTSEGILSFDRGHMFASVALARAIEEHEAPPPPLRLGPDASWRH